MRKILIALIIILLIPIGILGFEIYTSNQRDKEFTSDEQVVFTIDSGTSKSVIIDNLYEENLLSSKLYAKIDIAKNDLQFYAGDFGISESMTDQEVLEIISSQSSNIDTSREFLITEGSTIDVIAKDLATFTSYEDSADEILAYWSDPQLLNTVIADYDFVTDEILDSNILYPLEGYFYPATYKISDDESLEEITIKFLDTMKMNLEQIDTGDHTYHELITMASIIERETYLDSDKPIAAGVFYNRLDLGMPLQSDITVLYAKQEHKEQVLYEDLKFESPYNTYLNEGLTPGPISTVSLPSLEAAANPEDNDYIYFFADQDTGELYFSKTIEEHEKISAEHAWDFSN